MRVDLVSLTYVDSVIPYYFILIHMLPIAY